MASPTPHEPRASPEDVALVRRLFDRLVTRVGPPDNENVSLEKLGPAERVFLVLRAAADEVTRGGFEQLFYFLPHLARETEAAAELVRARAFGRLFEQANAIAFDEPPRKRSHSEARRIIAAVERGADALARLDDEFDARMADARTSLDAYLSAFVRSRPEEFSDYDKVVNSGSGAARRRPASRANERRGPETSNA